MLPEIELCSTLKLQPHTHILVKMRFRRSGQNDRCWPLKAYRNSDRSSVNHVTRLLILHEVLYHSFQATVFLDNSVLKFKQTPTIIQNHIAAFGDDF